MASQKQRAAARTNVKKAQSGARQKKTITKLSKQTRSDLGREGAKAAARKRGASKGIGSGAGAMTVTELRREAARLGVDGRSKMGKAQLIRAVGQKRSRSSSTSRSTRSLKKHTPVRAGALVGAQRAANRGFASLVGGGDGRGGGPPPRGWAR